MNLVKSFANKHALLSSVTDEQGAKTYMDFLSPPNGGSEGT